MGIFASRDSGPTPTLWFAGPSGATAGLGSQPPDRLDRCRCEIDRIFGKIDGTQLPAARVPQRPGSRRRWNEGQ